MINIKQTIENKLTSYNPAEFLPIYQDGELANRNAFITYKLSKIAQGAGHVATVTINFLDDLMEQARNQ